MNGTEPVLAALRVFSNRHDPVFADLVAELTPSLVERWPGASVITEAMVDTMIAEAETELRIGRVS